MGVCNCSMFCCTLLCVHSSIAIILMGKRELDALLNLSSWCLTMVERLFLAVPQGCLRFVIVVFPDHTHLLFLFYHTQINELLKNYDSQRYLASSKNIIVQMCYICENYQYMQHSQNTSSSWDHTASCYIHVKY